MGIRQLINRRPGTVLVVTGAAVVAVSGFLALHLRGTAHSRQDAQGFKAWYTVDDGRSVFLDEADRLVPFQHHGKPAYRCFVWTCDGGKTTFVSHLERVKAPTLAMFTRAGTTKVGFLDMPPGSYEVKRPETGDGPWLDIADPRAALITTPRCPDASGRAAIPQPVSPQ